MLLSLLLVISISGILKVLGWIAFVYCCLMMLQSIFMFGFVAASGKNPFARILLFGILAVVLFCLCTGTGVKW